MLRTLWMLALGLLCGCGRGEGDLVLYTSVDEPYARPIVERFERESGLRVRLVTDAEASKTVGLVERLRAEAGRPRADVYWGNEPFHTLALAREGLLAPWDPPDDVPGAWRDAEGRWAAVGLRARVIAVWPGVDPSIRARVRGIDDLAQPDLRGRVAMARPTAGTTGGHVAWLYASRGQERGDALMRALRDNGVVLLSGNGPAARAAAEGAVWFALTDNDDVEAVRASGLALDMLGPEELEGGTLLMPTTVALVRGAPEAAGGRRLAAYLASAAVEQALIDARFAGWSVRATDGADARLDATADLLPLAVRRADALLQGR